MNHGNITRMFSCHLAFCTAEEDVLITKNLAFFHANPEMGNVSFNLIKES